jgi:hypothetical protein
VCARLPVTYGPPHYVKGPDGISLAYQVAGDGPSDLIIVPHHFVLGLLGWMLEGADDITRAKALDNLRSTMEDHATPDGVTFCSAAWIVTATRP